MSIHEKWWEQNKYFPTKESGYAPTKKVVSKVTWQAALEWVDEELLLVDSCFDIPEFREKIRRELES